MNASADEGLESTVRKDVLVGQQLGEYVVRRRIGSGGMGVVYEGEHPVIGRKVAIKIIHPDSSESLRSRELVAEARAVSAIRHRGIIDIFGFGTLPGIGQYLVMEFLNGRPLDEVIRDRAPMLPAEVIRLNLEVLGALSAAHAVGVIHRDLKPGNIFVVLESNGTEYVKVLDFGLAKQGVAPNGTTPQTRASVIVGTPEYMAPEQACGQEVSPRTDLYAVGIIMFEILTGRLPFQGDSAMQTAIMQVQTPPPAPSSCVNGVPAELDALILRMLEKDPAQRPTSAEVVVRELKAIARTLAVELTRLSGFARALAEPPSEPVSSGRTQARQEAPGAAAQRGGARQPTTIPTLETSEAPRPRSRPALNASPPEAAARSKRPEAPARAQAARPRPAQETAPPTQLLEEESPQEERGGALAPDTEEIARSPRFSRGVKVAVTAGLAVLLIGAGVRLVMLQSDEGPSLPSGSGATVSTGPEPVNPVVVPPPHPKEGPPTTTVSRQQPSVNAPDSRSGTDTPKENVTQVPPRTEAPNPDKTPDSTIPGTASAQSKEPKTGTGKPRRIKVNGSLQLVAECWAEVFIDGEHFGKAPRPPIVLPAGKHTLELRANPKVIEQRKEIVIPPSDTFTHTISCGTRG